MASIQAAGLRTSFSTGHGLVGQVRAARSQRCTSLALPVVTRGSVAQSSIVSQSSDSSFIGAKFAGVPSGPVKPLSARRRQCAVRARYGLCMLPDYLEGDKVL